MDTVLYRAAWRRPLPSGLGVSVSRPRGLREIEKELRGRGAIVSRSRPTTDTVGHFATADCRGGEDESEAQMNTTTSSAQSEFAPSLLVKPSAEAPTVRPAGLKNDQAPAKRSWFSMRAPLVVGRYLTTLLLGIAATLAWQSYGDAARHMIASAASSLDQQQINAISLDLNAMRQSIDGLATSIATSQEQIMRSVDTLTASQEQMTREIAKVQAVEQYVLYRNSDPPSRAVPAPTPKPVQRPSQPPTALTPARNP
jgi:hypothetical protein